ncbi:MULTISPECIES: acyl-[acyl-carrier-protein] thioesterase [Butyrivibrio]|jgi:acyl-ACP thioesterase|uniref:Acyl-[acyl-carrier-protein] thioesterase n=1 Tax=Butyrivibrio fibrisolvens TaxID=831 RepID=A0A317G0M2_BUTFI|nr:MULTISPECIES: acyl-ACP thioesterase domain-containing protein [Butyrivibrio]PWT26896.1 acyl-[acyl-carrier-protein] thioesterase [Butyrivibrio fibrisolvens]
MYTFNSRIRYSELNSQGFLSTEALMNYFQDCSTFQSEDLGIGLEYLDEMNAAWVINSWQVDIIRYPKLGENVIIGTIPYDIKGFVGCRNFYMDTLEGERLAIANSVWALINIEKGTPVKVTSKMLEGYKISEKLPMDYQGRKISFPTDGNIRTLNEIIVQPFHLDTNQHVNNNQYINMAKDCMRLLDGNDKKIPVISRIRAEYRMQAHLGDTIYPVCSTQDKDGSVVYTVSLNDGSGKAYSIVEVTSLKKDERNV